MELTGKCKEDFERWYILICLKHSLTYYETADHYRKIDLKRYYSFNPSMQYGVYVDFFDSVGVIIGENSTFGYAGRQIFRLYVGINRHQSKVNPHPSTRQEARTEAIKKANEIYNN